VRFAARLRFTMDDSLLTAGKTESVRKALAQKVARERVGSEIDLMLRSQDPVGAMRLIANMNLTSTVFPVPAIFEENRELYNSIFDDGLHLLTVTHDHLCDCKITTPIWCEKGRVSEASANGVDDIVLIQDDEARRLLWYAALLKPLRDHYTKLGVIASKQAGMREGRKKKTRGVIMKLLVDELKRPVQDAKAVALVIKTADDLTGLLNSGCAFAATSCLLNEIRVVSNNKNGENTVICSMGERRIDSDIEDDPEWLQAMEYRKLVAKVLSRAGPLWRAAMVLSLSEQLAKMEDDTLAYTIEGDVVSFSPRNLWSLHAKQIINFSRHSFTNSSMNLKENREKEYFCNTIISQHRSYSWVL
jgi:tRNA nucleotidyltransferase/poly(A) polymerase